MRILQLVTRRQHRGAEVFATQLSDVLVARGHEVIVVGLYEPGAPPLVPEAADWRDLGLPSGARLSGRSVARVARFIRELEPDVVQANGSDTLKYGALAKRLSRGRWPFVYRNISVASRWLRGPLHRAWNRWLVGHVDHVVGVSRASLSDFIRTYGVDPAHATSIPRAVRIPQRVDRAAARRAIAELAGVPDDAPLLAHVGSFTPEKNHLWLLDAFGRIRQTHPAAHLVLMGDGPLRAAVESRIAERGLRDRVHALGPRPDAPELVAAADLLVLPSTVEGIPGVILEAGAQAVPSVATDVGGVREAVHDGETGLLVASGDREAFVASVASLLDDAARRQAMGRAARALVCSAFDLDAVAGRYEDLYLRLCGQRIPEATAAGKHG